MVSVPSRGILFPNKPTRSFITRLPEFPSPLGVSYFQIIKTVLLIFALFSFRPLSGYLISKWLILAVVWGITIMFPSPLGVSYFQIRWQIAMSFHIMVSVPSRGILFPNADYLFGNASGMLSFRPLSGYLISKFEEYREKKAK